MKYDTLIIDAGHGGESLGIYTTAGKRSPEPPPKGIYEGVFNRVFAQVLVEEAEKKGFKTVNLVGNSVINIRLKDRVDTEKMFYNDKTLFISIHVNAIGPRWQDKAAGMRVLYKSAEGKRVAQAIQKSVRCSSKRIGGWSVLSRERNNLYVLRKTKSPAVLIELGFMDNMSDLNYLISHKRETARVILEGIEAYNNDN